MPVRLPTGCLLAAALCAALGLTHPAAAKPPGLPVQEKIVCPERGTPDRLGQFAPPPPPAVADLPDEAEPPEPPRGLQTFGRCLLFGVHPLAALLEPAGLVDFDEDDGLPFLTLGDEEIDAGDPLALIGLGGLAGPLTPVVLWQLTAEVIGEECVPCTTSRCGGAVEQLTVMPKEVEQIPVMPPLVEDAEPIPAPQEVTSSDGFTCPYLKEQAAPKPAAAAALEECSPLDNLEKLERAEKAYRIGEYYRRTGHPGSACFYYETARRLCPGSRVERMASERLYEMAHWGAPAETEAATEEQEPIPAPQPCAPPPPPLPHSPTGPGAYLQHPPKHFPPSPAEMPLTDAKETQIAVGCLLQKFNELFKEARYHEAEVVAFAARTLDPDNPVADAAVHMARMQIEKKVEAENIFEENAGTPSEGVGKLIGTGVGAATGHPIPPAEPIPPPQEVTEGDADDGASLRPALPPVDPPGADALQGLLTEPAGPPAPVVGLFVEPPDALEFLAEEEESEAAEVPAAAAAMAKAVGPLIDLLAPGACAEVVTDPGGARVRCQFLVGSSLCRIVWDGKGEWVVTVERQPAEAGSEEK
ncbi:MAG TPA: hypothetical protein VFA26_11780 [Gemmataceae bacterium]|nr:hypothetical protein [Gemmataceae bacterium]